MSVIEFLEQKEDAGLLRCSFAIYNNRNTRYAILYDNGFDVLFILPADNEISEKNQQTVIEKINNESIIKDMA